jgi:hypothetical protein
VPHTTVSPSQLKIFDETNCTTLLISTLRQASRVHSLGTMLVLLNLFEQMFCIIYPLGVPLGGAAARAKDGPQPPRRRVAPRGVV